MLVLARRENEGIRIGQDITISVARIEDGRVRIAIAAPADVRIMREELLESSERRGRGCIETYRASRKQAADLRLTNTISLAADLILKLEAGCYPAEMTEEIWDTVEAAITRYADGRAQ